MAATSQSTSAPLGVQLGSDGLLPSNWFLVWPSSRDTRQYCCGEIGSYKKHVREMPSNITAKGIEELQVTQISTESSSKQLARAPTVLALLTSMVCPANKVCGQQADMGILLQMWCIESPGQSSEHCQLGRINLPGKFLGQLPCYFVVRLNQNPWLPSRCFCIAAISSGETAWRVYQIQLQVQVQVHAQCYQLDMINTSPSWDSTSSLHFWSVNEFSEIKCHVQPLGCIGGPNAQFLIRALLCSVWWQWSFLGTKQKQWSQLSQCHCSSV